jgi:V/A-type H+-transporting ATPase subunit F
MQGKVAVLGDEDFVMPFSALGVDTYPVGPAPRDLTESARRIIEQKYALVVIAENVAPAVEQVFAASQKDPIPCIVIAPFTMESGGFATQSLGEVIKLATGINILQSS